MRIFLISFCFLIHLDVFPQCNEIQIDFNCLQGLWQKATKEDEKEKSFNVYEGNSFISFNYDGKTLEQPLGIFKVGFIDYQPKMNDSLDVRSLKLQGKYYIVAEEPVKTNKTLLYTCGGDDQSCDMQSNEVGDLVYYRKHYIPLQIWKSIVNQSKVDGRDYVQEFKLNKYYPKRKVAKAKCIIYSTPNKNSGMYLIQGDEVEILREDGDWLFMRYSGKKIVEGWIMRGDIE